MDLRRELERDLGHGPALPSPERRLVAGRAALRRRRIVVATGAAGAVAAVVLPVAIVAGGGPTTSRELPPAGPDPTVPAQDGPLRLDSAVPVTVDRVTRDVVVEPGARVEQGIDGVADGIVGWSAAVDVTHEGERYWVVLAWDVNRAEVVYDEVAPGRTGFADWVEKRLPALERAYAPGRGKSVEAPGLRFEGGRFSGSGKTVVAEQRADVDLGEEFAPGGTVAAALVEVDGYRMLFLHRALPGVPGQLLQPDEVPVADLDGALAALRERYADIGFER